MNTETESAKSDVQLIGHHLKAMHFGVDENHPFTGERALPYDAQHNIVVDLFGRVFGGGPGDFSIKHRQVAADLFEVSLTCDASSFCDEDGKETAIYDSQLIYAGLFRISDGVDSDMLQRCGTILLPHMKNAVDRFITFSGTPRRFGWRMF